MTTRTPIDETQPPSGHWRYDDEADCWYLEYASKSLEGAHRFAREQAQPYIAEALKRVSAWLESRAFEDSREQLVGRFDRWLSRQVAAMARGERPIP